MSLGESRQVFHTNVDCTVSGVAERGGVLSYVPGVAGLCEYADATAVSGQLSKPAGLLMDDVEDLNYYRHPEYLQRNVVPKGSVVGQITDGEIWTDFVETATADGASVGTYIPGDTLYLADGGQVSRQQVHGARVVIGKVLEGLTADGFLKIRIEL